MMVSALWHGFYPIYYVVFFFIFLIVEIAKETIKLEPVISKLIPWKFVRIFLAQAFCKYIYVYILITHFALLFDRAWIAAYNLSFIPPVLVITTFILIKFVAPSVARYIDPSFGKTRQGTETKAKFD